VLRYHAGRYAEALETLKPLHGAYSTLDLRNDLIWHYEYWAGEGLETQQAETRVRELAAAETTLADMPPAERVEKLRVIADGYFEVEAYARAAQAYEQLQYIAQEQGDASIRLHAAFREAVAHHHAGDYAGAIERFHRLLQQRSESEIGREAKYELATSLQAEGNLKEAIPIWKYLWSTATPKERKTRLERPLSDGYLSLRDDPKAVRDYKEFFHRVSVPQVLYWEDDADTKGNWPGRYGNYAYALLAMRGYPVVGGEGWPIAYRVYTGDPAESGRMCMPALRSSEVQHLFNPATFSRTDSYMDDRGETHPFDNRGPDMFLDVAIPDGIFQLSVYSMEHEVSVMTRNREVLAVAPRREDAVPVYRRFLCVGPLWLTIRIRKGVSLAAILKAFFLDRLQPPPDPPEVSLLSSTINVEDALGKALEHYREIQRVWYQDGERYFKNLPRFLEVIRYADAYLQRRRDPAKTLLAHRLKWESEWQLGNYDAAEAGMEAYVQALGQSESDEERLKELIKEGEQRNLPLLTLKALEGMKQRLGLQGPERTRYDRILLDYYLELGQVEQAKVLCQAMQNHPDLGPHGRYILGLLYLCEGDKPRALASFDELIQLAPTSTEAGWARLYKQRAGYVMEHLGQ